MAARAPPHVALSTLLSRSLSVCGGGGGRGEGSVSVCSVCREDSPLYSPLCVMVTFSTPEAVPFAEETFYRFIFAEEIWELEASLQSIGAGVGPPGLNPDRSSN